MASPTLSVLRELWWFVRSSKKYWLAPIILILLLIGFSLTVAQSWAVASFVYTLF